MTEVDTTDCVVVRCSGCKRIIYTAVNEPRVMDQSRYEEIGKMVLWEGHTVEHMPVNEVRIAAFGCKCPKLKNK